MKLFFFFFLCGGGGGVREGEVGSADRAVGVMYTLGSNIINCQMRKIGGRVWALKCTTDLVSVRRENSVCDTRRFSVWVFCAVGVSSGR